MGLLWTYGLHFHFCILRFFWLRRPSKTYEALKKKGEIMNIWPLCTTLKTRHWVDLFKNIVLYLLWPHLLHCISLFLWRQKDGYSSKNKRRDWCVLREKCARKTCWLVAMVSFNTFDILIVYIHSNTVQITQFKKKSLVLSCDMFWPWFDIFFSSCIVGGW